MLRVPADALSKVTVLSMSRQASFQPTTTMLCRSPAVPSRSSMPSSELDASGLPMIVKFESVGAERGVASLFSPLLSASMPLSPASSHCWSTAYCTLPVQPSVQSSMSSPTAVISRCLASAVPPKNSTPSSAFWWIWT